VLPSQVFITGWQLLLHRQPYAYVISEFSDVGHETSSGKGSNRVGFLTLSFHLKKKQNHFPKSSGLIKLQ
jgi:hypothetical protein